MRIRLVAAAVLAGAGLAAPAHAVDFHGLPLWESDPGRYSYAPYYYYVPPPAFYNDPHTSRYYRQY